MPFATGRTRRLLQLASICVLLLMGWIDFATGYELGLFVFYFIPVSIAAWWGGRTPGLIMGCGCAVAWYLADQLAHHPYSHAYLVYWETFIRLASFITTALTISKIREITDALRGAQVELHRAHEENAALRRRLDGEAGP